tara:strand:+ start:305 stop:499 length:195 start_codon:yes stop_codon:yes gene_type:complete
MFKDMLKIIFVGLSVGANVVFALHVNEQQKENNALKTLSKTQIETISTLQIQVKALKVDWLEAH